MVTAVITVIMDAFEAVFGGIGTSLQTLWETLIYEEVTGLTPFAEWMLLFIGFGLGIGVLMMLLRKVL